MLVCRVISTRYTYLNIPFIEHTCRTSKLQNRNFLKPSHNEPQARQCRVIIPLVNDVLRTYVFYFHSQAPATSLPLAGVLPRRLTFVCYSKLFAPRVFLSMGCHGTPGVEYLIPGFSTVSLTIEQIFPYYLDHQSSHQTNRLHW